MGIDTMFDMMEGSNLVQGIVDGVMDGVMQEILQGAQNMLPILILIAIPSLVWACANCFFGYRIFRIVLVVQGVLIGGGAGGALIGVMSESKAGIIIGFIIGAVIGGLINWYLYMIGVFLQSFGTGFMIGSLIFMLITKNFGLAFMLGLILGLVVGVLSCMFMIPVVLVTTAVNGGVTLASTLAIFIMILSKNPDTFKPANIIFTILFIGLGIFFQYNYEKGKGTFVGKQLQPMPARHVYSQQSEQSATAEMLSQMPQKVANRICQLVGMEGMYKGFEFDIDGDTVFGRDAEQCNIIFPKEAQGISRIQCQVTLNPERTVAFLSDNFSSYGTKLNGTKLEYGKIIALQSGDIIHFGENNIFKVQY